MNIHDLCRLVDYAPSTGALVFREAWPDLFASSDARSADYRAKIWNAMCAGQPAFATPHGTGYLCGRLLGVPYKAHRVAWAVTFGTWPQGEIDHINGKRDDNRVMNLRDVTKAENQRNAKQRKSNTSGVVGVSWVIRDQAWVVQIQVDGTRHRRNFKSRDEAVAWRLSEQVRLGFSPRHGTTS